MVNQLSTLTGAQEMDGNVVPSRRLPPRRLSPAGSTSTSGLSAGLSSRKSAAVR
jgi:hypothetical protein